MGRTDFIYFIEDRFGQSGTPAELFADYGLTAENIAENARRLVK